MGLKSILAQVASHKGSRRLAPWGGRLRLNPLKRVSPLSTPLAGNYMEAMVGGGTCRTSGGAAMTRLFPPVRRCPFLKWGYPRQSDTGEKWGYIWGYAEKFIKNNPAITVSYAIISCLALPKKFKKVRKANSQADFLGSTPKTGASPFNGALHQRRGQAPSTGLYTKDGGKPLQRAVFPTGF